MATLSFSPRWAPPEVIAAFEAKQPQIEADIKMDVWSVGIIAYELLTHRPVFDKTMASVDVVAQLMGRSQLPWEDPQQQDADFRQLRMLKRSVLKCLSRSAAERPSASELLAAWERLFDHTVAPGEFTYVAPESTHALVSSTGVTES